MAEWRPSPKQAEFYSLPYSIKEAFFGGGAGSAKTETLLYYPLVHKFHENPRFKGVFMRRTTPELRNEVIPRSRTIYKRFGATFNGQEGIWTFPSGALIYMAHCENENDVSKYDSMEINLFMPDELTSFSEWQYLYIAFERVRTSKGTGLPAIIRAGGMPGGIGHTWVKKRFVDPAKPGTIIIGKGNNKRFYVHATLADNPHIDPNYAQSLEALPEAEKRAKKYGDWNAFLGQVFDEFRDRKYPDEPENALHSIEPFDIPDYWPKIFIGDWGYRAYTWIGCGAIAPTGQLFIYREMFWRGKKISFWAPQVRDFIESENPKVVKFCRSAGQDRGQEQTIQQQIEQELGCPVELTQNNPGSRIANKILIHEYLRWRPNPIIERPKNAFNNDQALFIFRNKGLAAYKEYLNSFNPPEKEAIPRLQIFNCCPLLINTIKACVYAKPKNNQPAEDVAEFDGDDPYDGLRYMVDAASRYVTESKKEFERVKQTQAIEVDFQQHQDYNRVFRQAMAQEKSRPKYQGIRRYHH